MVSNDSKMILDMHLTYHSRSGFHAVLDLWALLVTLNDNKMPDEYV